MFKVLMGAAALMTCVACVPPQTIVQADDRIIGPGFVDGGLQKRGGGRINTAVGIFGENGVYVVCAATQGVRDRLDAQAVGALNVSVNGQILVSGLDWAPRYEGQNSLDGRVARCRQTNVAVVANPDFDISMSRTRFR